MLPFLAVGAIGIGLYKAFSSDSSGSTSSSNRGSVERNYKREKREEIHSDIESYKKAQVDYIKGKYGVDISIDSDSFEVLLVNENTTLKQAMENLNKGISKIETTVDLLKEEKVEYFK